MPAQTAPDGLATIEIDGVTNAFTVMVIPLLVTVAGLGQTALLVSTQVMASPFAGL